MGLSNLTSNSDLIEELRKRCGFGPSILKVAQDAQAGRRNRPQTPLRVSAEAEEGALTIDQYMAR